MPVRDEPGRQQVQRRRLHEPALRVPPLGPRVGEEQVHRRQPGRRRRGRSTAPPRRRSRPAGSALRPSPPRRAVRATPGTWTSTASTSWSGCAAAYAMAAAPCPHPMSRTTGASRPNASRGTSGPGGSPRAGQVPLQPLLGERRPAALPPRIRADPAEPGAGSALSRAALSCAYSGGVEPLGGHPLLKESGHEHVRQHQGQGPGTGRRARRQGRRTASTRPGDFVDEKTGGQHSAQIDGGVEQAKNALDGLDGQDDDIP